MAIKTAQDILDETDVTPGAKHSSREEEHDQVDEAYETISKKLENLRKVDEDENPSTDSNSAGAIAQDQKEPEEPKDEKDDEEIDPLDNEDEEEPKETEEPEESEDTKDDKEEDKDEEGVDPLDDVEEEKADEPEEKEEREEKSMEPEKNPEEPTSLNDLVEDEQSDTHIPNLRPSPQETTFKQRPIMNESRFDPGEEFGPQDPDKFFNRHNANPPVRRSNKWHVLVLILIGLGVIGATVYLLKGQFKDNGDLQTSPSPSAEALSSPLPSPSPEPNRSDFKVRVLNGTGKTGLAKTVSDKLKDLGYQQEKTANATNSAFLQTVVRSKTSSASVSAQLIRDLSPDYDALDQTSLKDNDPADFEVILGAK